MRPKILCTFSKNSIDIETTLITITDCYEIVFNKIFILQNVENKNEIIFTYNINPENIKGDVPYGTISVHRKKETNTIYTINSLNYLISLLNDGIEDSKFEVPWTNYRNCILVTNNNELKRIDTSVYKMITI